jgi:hypothetical protein
MRGEILALHHFPGQSFWATIPVQPSQRNHPSATIPGNLARMGSLCKFIRVVFYAGLLRYFAMQTYRDSFAVGEAVYLTEISYADIACDPAMAGC